MTEQELRELVRAAIARVQGQGQGQGTLALSHPAPSHLAPSDARSHHSHPSHASHMMFTVPSGDGPCIIEPAVMCNHCGYCKSMGH